MFYLVAYVLKKNLKNESHLLFFLPSSMCTLQTRQAATTRFEKTSIIIIMYHAMTLKRKIINFKILSNCNKLYHSLMMVAVMEMMHCHWVVDELVSIVLAREPPLMVGLACSCFVEDAVEEVVGVVEGVHHIVVDGAYCTQDEDIGEVDHSALVGSAGIDADTVVDDKFLAGREVGMHTMEEGVVPVALD